MDFTEVSALLYRHLNTRNHHKILLQRSSNVFLRTTTVSLIPVIMVNHIQERQYSTVHYMQCIVSKCLDDYTHTCYLPTSNKCAVNKTTGLATSSLMLCCGCHEGHFTNTCNHKRHPSLLFATIQQQRSNRCGCKI